MVRVLTTSARPLVVRRALLRLRQPYAVARAAVGLRFLDGWKLFVLGAPLSTLAGVPRPKCGPVRSTSGSRGPMSSPLRGPPLGWPPS